MNLSEVSKLMATIATEFRSFQVSEERAQLWAVVLKNTDLRDAMKGLAALMGEARQFAPQVGEIKQAALVEARKRATPATLHIAPQPDLSPQEMAAMRERLRNLVKPALEHMERQAKRFEFTKRAAK